MTDWLQTGSRAAGLDWVNGLYRQNAQRQAGEALTRGDYGAAANTLAQNGDLEGFGQVQAYGQQQQDRAAAQDKETTARQLQFTLSTAQALEDVAAQGGDVLAAYNGLRPALVQMGTAPEQIDQLGQFIAANPTQALGQIRQLAGQQLQELEFINLGDGTAVAVNTQTGQEVNRYERPRSPLVVGGVVLDPDTLEPIVDTREPKYQTVTNSDGTTSVVAIDQPAPIRGGSGGGDGSFESIIPRLLQREGGFVAQDGSSGAPANFGINQRANPDIDVRNLTQEQAAEIYRDRYWNPVVQAGVPPEAREAVFDFAVNAGPRRAIQMWNDAGGDIGRFNESRLSFYRRLPDYNRYGPAWERRVQETSGGAGSSVPVGGGTRTVAQGQDRGPAVRQLSPQEVNELGLPEGTVAQRRADGSINVVSRGGSERYTEGQRNAAYFAYRLNGARDTLARLEQRGIVRPTPAIIAFGEGRVLENALGEEDRLWLQAARNWLAPVLRKDTGAAITAPEVVYYMGEYLPSPTDSPAVIAQKAAARRRAEEALRGLAGGAYEELFPGSGGGRPQGQRNVRFQQTPQQIETRRRIVPDGQPSGARPGTSQNPYIINPQSPAASYNNIPSGGLYIDPQGRIRRKP